MARVVLVTTAFQAVGCYKYVDIKPTELVKLNGSYSRAVGSTQTPAGSVTIVESTVAHVERPDGRLVELKGDFDAVVRTRSDHFKFVHPVNARLDGKFLVVASGNHAATPLVLSEVERVGISQYDGVMTVLVAVGAGLLGGFLLISVLED